MEPCAQAQGCGGHVHRDMVAVIRCVCRHGWRDTLVEHTRPHHHHDRSPLLPSRCSSSRWRRSPAGAGQHLCQRLLAGRGLWSGTSWRTWETSAPSCRFSIFLCRKWWTKCGFFSSHGLAGSSKSSSSCPSRAVLKAPQVVEQLVEVPTIVSYSAQCRADRKHPCSACSWSSSSRFSPRTGFNRVRLRADH